MPRLCACTLRFSLKHAKRAAYVSQHIAACSRRIIPFRQEPSQFMWLALRGKAGVEGSASHGIAARAARIAARINSYLPSAVAMLARFFKNCSPGRAASRTPSTAFPNSTCPRWPRSAACIRADARACTLARDGAPRGKSCSTAFRRPRAKDVPSHPCEIFRCGPRGRQALPRASPRSERRFRPMPREPAAACIARDGVAAESSSAEPSAGSICSGHCACAQRSPRWRGLCREAWPSRRRDRDGRLKFD